MNSETDDKHDHPDNKFTSSLSSHSDEPSAISKETETEKKDKNRLKWRECREWARLIVETLTLIAVFWYAGVAYKQWGEMIRSNEFTRQTLEETKRSNELSQRSWVVVAGLRTPPAIAMGTQKVRLSIIIQNLGKVPAVDMAFVGPNQQFVQKLPPKFSTGNPEQLFLPEDQGTGVLSPGASTDVAFDVGPLTEERLAAIKNKQLFFMILGAFRYSDVFGKNRFTVFCYRYDMDERQFISCPGGNAAP